MIKSLTIAAALAAGAMLATPAAAAPMSAAASSVLATKAAGDLVETVQYRRYGGPRYYGRGPGPRGYYGPRYRGGRGAAVGAGIAAGAIGALAAGALLAPGPVYAEPVPVYPAPRAYYGGPSADEIAYCSRRFRSYDPATGTYIANGGVVRSCP